MQDEVKSYSGEQNAARVKAAINTTYRHIRNMLKWPCLLIPAATPITLVAGTQTYSLASDFRFPSRFWVVDSNNGQPIYLKPYMSIMNNVNRGTTQWYRLKKANAGSATTKPGWVIDLEDIPNAEFVTLYPYLYYDYYYAAADLSGDSDVTKFSDDEDAVIVLGAAVLLTAKQDDQRGFAMIGQMYLDAKSDMIQRAIEQYGNGIVVGPGEEITETSISRISDYGRML